VVNGRVYVPTFSGHLAIYGLLSGSSQSDAAVTIGNIANAASLMGNGLAPNEVVAIYGSNLGPPSYLEMEVNGDHAPFILAGTQVLFNGVPAPVLYTSTGEVGAIVPSGINGAMAQAQVIYNGKLSQTLPMPFVSADPAIFAQDGTGGGTGSILNEDGSVNSWDSPASPGSVVTMLVTGVGQTMEAGEDGKVADATSLTPVLPLKLLLDGELCEIVSVTSVPGMVQGFVQIKVKIPETLPSSNYVHVVLKVGGYTSPTTVTLVVQ
jgi:uncharacterized protein (TIGR03437 family)